MEFLFKRHFWIVHLVFIFGVAYVLARTSGRGARPLTARNWGLFRP